MFADKLKLLLGEAFLASSKQLIEEARPVGNADERERWRDLIQEPPSAPLEVVYLDRSIESDPLCVTDDRRPPVDHLGSLAMDNAGSDAEVHKTPDATEHVRAEPIAGGRESDSKALSALAAHLHFPAHA